MKFNDFIGNQKVKELVSAMLESKRFPHAFVIDGEYGTGKKTLARLIARALVCRGEDKPCDSCAQCRKAKENIHPDIFEHIPSGTFRVDTIRQIIDDAYMKPNEAEYKIYILANAECMNASAQNALLKILEEPPEYVIFIMTTQAKSALLSTVLSRSVVITLEGVDADDGAKYICTKNEGTDYAAAKKSVETFNGNIGKALDSMADSKTAELITVCSDICKALVSESEFSLLTKCAVFQKDRDGIVFACTMLKSIFRDALLADENNNFTSGQQDMARLLRSRLSRAKLAALTAVCDELKKEAVMNENNALLITKMCYRLREAAGK